MTITGVMANLTNKLCLGICLCLAACQTITPAIPNTVGAVWVENGQGSGTLIAPNIVLTARHVIVNTEGETYDQAVFRYRDENYFSAAVLDLGVAADLAVVILLNPVAEGSPIAWEINDNNILNLGYNIEDLRCFTNNIDGLADKGEFYYTRNYDTPIDDVPSPGNSGGGVFQEQDGQYRLIGVITRVQRHGLSSPAYGYFVPLFPYKDRLLALMPK